MNELMPIAEPEQPMRNLPDSILDNLALLATDFSLVSPLGRSLFDPWAEESKLRVKIDVL
ncbi:hypothetical protein [Bythopirellula goksoeyrii]|uniref:Uncharacterized protein n=1 Tax=Bythopirellula goksoeyrii TaxID=1400387 RepID=A0A5B9Q1C5_9BACT|nr:hypothetical protein [Bythopirellula goksoeyrii]QEG32847.1 hypothetical protein Pr1d_01080 [Bythopirellula goksoeyrii]